MLLTVGRITRPHGIRGEVIVEVHTDEPEQRFSAGAVLIAQPPEPRRGAGHTGRPGRGPGGPAAPTPEAQRSSGPGAAATSGAVEAGAAGLRWRLPPTLTVAAVRSHTGRLIVVFDGVADRDVAEELRGVRLCVDSAELAPPADPDEFHDYQLIGLTAVDVAGVALGEVTSVDHAPAADLLVLRRPDGRSALVPFIKAMVPTVDLAGGRVVLDPPPGLLDL